MFFLEWPFEFVFDETRQLLILNGLNFYWTKAKEQRLYFKIYAFFKSLWLFDFRIGSMQPNSM